MKSIHAAILLAFLILPSCRNMGGLGREIVLIGATLLNPGEEPVSRAIVVIRGSRIVHAGFQAEVPVPAGSTKMDLSGKFLLPAPVHIPENARMRRITTLEQLQTLIDVKWRIVGGMVQDTEKLPAALLESLRAGNMVFVPQLFRIDDSKKLAVAQRNALRLLRAGIPIAASAGRGWQQECNLLLAAGFTASEVIQASTSFSALAAQAEQESGRLKSGFLANIWLLSGNPLEDPARLHEVERIMTEGSWGT